jgi:sialic acid synthase
MATRQDIHRAVTTVRKYHEQIILLYCVSEYPTPIEHINLKEMKHLSDTYGCLAGISDHSAGIVVSQAAAVMDAVMVEKHLTLARAMKGTDHAASLEPDGMARLVRNIRIGEKLTCSKPRPSTYFLGVQGVQESRAKLGRSIIAAHDIKAGTTIDESMLTLKSPGTGVRWGHRDLIVGHEAAREIKADTLIMESDVLCVHTLEVAEYG